MKSENLFSTQFMQALCLRHLQYKMPQSISELRPNKFSQNPFNFGSIFFATGLPAISQIDD